MVSELSKTSEVYSEIKTDTAKNQVDIGKRIDVNKNSIETSKDEVDISKRVQPDTNSEHLKQERIDIEPQHKLVNGHEQYFDDNGKLFRIDNDLMPNTNYEINGYKYTTDDEGRITSASGRLKLKQDGRERLEIRDSIESIGKGDQQKSDDRGHLIGDRFDGTNGLENMVPQDSKINQGDFNKFECDLAKEVKLGKEVTVDVQPIYSEDSRRPDAIVVTYSIEGEIGMRIFPNGQEEAK